MLNISAQVMRSSFERTFREQGSPAGSWAPLAQSTIDRGRGGAGRKILIQSGRLKNSITYQVSGNQLTMGSNLVYSRIQQQGGNAGRHGRTRIPARPYLLFRPEDPQTIAAAANRYLHAQPKAGALRYLPTPLHRKNLQHPI